MLDEIRMMQELRPAQPRPGSAATEAARARLLAAAAEPGATRYRPRRLASSRKRWLAAVPALAIIGALAVLAAQLTTGGQVPNEPAAPVPANLTARNVLLTAATIAAAIPDEGNYWRISSFTGSLVAAGPNAHPYALEERVPTDTRWFPRSPAGKIFATHASSKFAFVLPTPGAAAAWRADGSPPLRRDYPGFLAVDTYGDLYFGDESPTIALFQALPSSTAGLKAAIARALSGLAPGSNAQNQQIFQVCIALLGHDPVTSAVRAAAFRVLAALPGIRLEGKVTDPLGRAGYGISLPGALISVDPGSVGSSAERSLIVVSPSATVLAEETLASRPTTTAVHVMPASGAIPGSTTCPAGWYAVSPAGPYVVSHRQECIRKGDHITSDGRITGPNGGPPKTFGPIPLGVPILAVPAGTVVGYTAYLSAGWANAAPPPSPPAHDTPRQQGPSQ
jgi:hypothetical protein